MIRIPANPTKIAVQRRHPTNSPNNGVASAVTKSGPAKEIAMLSANGLYFKPVRKKKTDAIKKQFTRDKTGSMNKFKKVLSKCLKNNALNFSDLLN